MDEGHDRRDHARLRLRDGVRALRRGPGQLQVGLDPATAVRLPESAEVRRTLDVLAAHRPASDADPRVLARLGGLVESATEPGVGRVDLREFGPTPAPGARALLTAAGLSVVDPLRETADVGLLVGLGEPARDLLDEWTVDGLPHLVARVSEGVGVVGPFVVPGRTACQRCIDAHRADDDQRWSLLLEQQVDGPADREPPAATLALALAWAVSDVVTYLAGGTPATSSATLRLPPALGGAELVSWRQHAGCGCSWDLATHHACGRMAT